jgi:hypothetical protein
MAAINKHTDPVTVEKPLENNSKILSVKTKVTILKAEWTYESEKFTDRKIK